MKAIQADWRAGLDAARDLTDQEKQQFGFVLGWYEGWRLKMGLELGRGAAVAFWRAQVISKPRKDWQLEHWAEAMRWLAKWLSHCAAGGLEPRSLGERLQRAVTTTGARRGLALRTRETYAGWVIRYGEWVGSAREMMNTDCASVWLAELVEKGKVSYATQKQALNAVVFFLKDVCGRGDDHAARSGLELHCIAGPRALPWATLGRTVGAEDGSENQPRVRQFEF